MKNKITILISSSLLVLLIFVGFVGFKHNSNYNSNLNINITENNSDKYNISVDGNEKYFNLKALGLEKYTDFTEIIQTTKFNGNINIYNNLKDENLDVKIIDSYNQEIFNSKNLSPTHLVDFNSGGKDCVLLIKKS